ncbi:MAG: hybrid sensor histidine kinase/response regulator [Gammaproteobacteria bacterium]|nr:hybrid sensor histidine kinase/response regulator [Gammaproteobacteria bacterium]
MSGKNDYGDVSMLDLFRIEVEGQSKILSDSLLALEDDPGSAEHLEQLMRASHSIKGAARMVDVDIAVRVAHVMEDCFVAAQEGKITLNDDDIDTLLHGVDILSEISQLSPEISPEWFSEHASDIESFVDDVSNIINQTTTKKASTTVKKQTPDIEDASPAETVNINDTGIITDNELMLDLFKQEANTHINAITFGLDALDLNNFTKESFEYLRQAAYSLRGGAALVELYSIIQLGRLMEDCFSSARDKAIQLTPDDIAGLIKCTEIAGEIVSNLSPGKPTWESNETNRQNLTTAVNALTASLGQDFDFDTQQAEPATTPSEPVVESGKAQAITSDKKSTSRKKTVVTSNQKADKINTEPADTAVRVSSSSLNRLMGLAGESIVESRRLRPYADSLLALKRRQSELFSKIDKLSELAYDENTSDLLLQMMSDIRKNAVECRNTLSERLEELETFDRSLNNLSGRLNREVIASRMRPFADGTHGFQRMVRDVGRSLEKKVKLEILGLNTMVDRDIMEKIEAPLNHLLRNSVDHGIESSEEREKAGKPIEGTIKLQAMHSSGMLSIIVEDDGKGVDIDALKKKIINKGMASEQMVKKMSEAELLDFMFLPGFSTRDNVTEVSGRGVGLDVVHSVIQEMRGVIRTTSTPGQGIRFQLQLPLTLSVIRALLVDICGEPYAFPLARIDRTLKLNKESIEVLEGRQYFTLDNSHIGIVSAEQVLELKGEIPDQGDEVSIVIIGEKLNRYAIVVDQFLGERSMVVQKIDPMIGKIRDISTAAILDDGTPAMIVDVDDMIRSIDLFISGGRVANVHKREHLSTSKKRVLVVDDSITVREVERNMLETRGYSVDVAVDGMDGWNAVRTGEYDLVISDIDMPRMNGFEFVEHIKSDNTLNKLPVMIVSYKDREEDRLRGLEVGADYYLTKGSFQDETLLDAVEELIGKAN